MTVHSSSMDQYLSSALFALQEQQGLASERFAAQDRRIADLEERNKLQDQRVEELERRLRELQPPPAELVFMFRWAKRWRMLMGFGGLVGPGLGLGAVLIKSKDALTASKMA